MIFFFSFFAYPVSFLQSRSGVDCGWLIARRQKSVKPPNRRRPYTYFYGNILRREMSARAFRSYAICVCLFFFVCHSLWQLLDRRSVLFRSSRGHFCGRPLGVREQELEQGGKEDKIIQNQSDASSSTSSDSAAG
jgi:hypothetical protein